MAGCVYVPIDPDFPKERMSYMLEDTKVKHVLVDRAGGKPYQRVIACGVPSADIHVISEIATADKTASAPFLKAQSGQTRRLLLCLHQWQHWAT